MPARTTILSILTLFLASVAHATAATPTDKPSSPKPWMEQVIDRGKVLATKKIEAGTSDEEKWRDESKDLIDDSLDWPELTMQAMGRQWAKLQVAQQEEFAKMLRGMIEASYQSKLRMVAKGSVKKPEQVKIEWLDEKIEGENASVSARVKSDKDVAVLEFKMKWRNNRWRVWDISIDDVSTVRTYRTQFGKIIGKDGFDALLARMKTKTNEIREGRAELGP